MRQPPKAVLVAVFVSALALITTACSSGSPVKVRPTSETKIEVKSAAVAGERIPIRYTCDGQDVSPPIEWGAVPADIRQLALFLVGFTPKPGTKTYRVSVKWAVAGVKPGLHRLAAGRLPAGAYLATDRSGRHLPYSLCPSKGTSVHYQFELYGVPAAVRIPARFSAAAVFRALTRPSGPTRANAHGGFVALYTRA